ncbi:PaaI family thioesterase [Pseudomonas sp. 5Ae-yellow]|uniref:PaaI family thioesterase n=1 Tax=Pseudomonas sp. 5Ae-yellow TaxID=2759848 RepID=UPI0015F5A45B|nr:PaaI family thioesterase [Pseudomonas sp. 5Ae-yellow]MBA6420290.1 PaaI family thioesterase [Pseudomonas sp. 5Ae-yellow]|tara:strand:+ start:424 stop:840 length:417 start_codon:yes stop_codon:yes gene_type:complete
MQKHQPLQDKIQQILPMAAFNRWLDLQLVSAAPGEVTLHVPWRDEFGQYSGFLHAGILGALIDTACGFAAITQTDRVLASQYTVRCLRPAVAETFVVRGWVVKPGRQQVFSAAEIYALGDESRKLFAVGDAMLVPVTA